MKKLLFFSMILFLSLSCSKKETVVPYEEDLLSNQKMIDIANQSGQSFIEVLDHVGSQLVLERSTQEEVNSVLGTYLDEDLSTYDGLSIQSMSEWLNENKKSLNDVDFEIYSSLRELLETDFFESELAFMDDLKKLQQQVLESNSERKQQFLISLSTIKYLVGFTKKAFEDTQHSYHAYLFGSNSRIDPCAVLRLIAAQLSYNDCLENGQFGSEETAQRVCFNQGLYAYHNYDCP